MKFLKLGFKPINNDIIKNRILPINNDIIKNRI